MEFSVKINGIYHDLKAKNPSEAAELIRQLTDIPSGAGSKQEKPIEEDVFGGAEDTGTVKAVLGSLRGTKTAKFIKVLANMEGLGGTDKVIKAEMSSDGGVNLAPYVASVSKACKREGIKLSEVLIRKERRFRAGKVQYYYRLTDAAAEFVMSIPDFEYDEDFDFERKENIQDTLSPDGSKEATASTSIAIAPKSIRSLVRGAARSKTIREIAEATGLKVPQVRGAVNGENDRYDKESSGSDEIRYTYKES